MSMPQPQMPSTAPPPGWAPPPMMMPKKRPLGVSILAILTMLFGVLTIVVGLGLLALAALGSAFIPAGLPGFISGLLAVFGAVLILFGLIAIAAGIGLWRLRSWAWWLTIIVSVLSIISGALTLSFVTVGLWLLILIYLFVVRQHFGIGAPVGPAMPQPPSM